MFTQLGAVNPRHQLPCPVTGTPPPLVSNHPPGGRRSASATLSTATLSEPCRVINDNHSQRTTTANLEVKYVSWKDVTRTKANASSATTAASTSSSSSSSSSSTTTTTTTRAAATLLTAKVITIRDVSARARAASHTPSRRTSHHQLHAVNFGVAESASTRPYMEDRHQVLPALPPIHAGIQMTAPLPHLPLDASYAAVFDGHSGAQTAEQAAARLHVHLTSSPALRSFLGGGFKMVSTEAKERVVGQALRHAFHATDEEILAGCRQAPGERCSGSTALVALRLGSHLYTANAGDCRAVLCRNGRPLRLTKEHQPELASERQRIEREGGLLHFQNGWRVVVDGRDGLPRRGVRVTRGLGDLHFKEPQRLVECEPDVRRTLLEPCDTFMVLGTDGIWNSVHDDMALEVVQAALREQAAAGASATDAANAAAKRLLWRALDRGCQDNATVVVMVLDWDTPTPGS